MLSPQASSVERGEPSALGGASGRRTATGAGGPGVWVPLAGYFEPYFEGIHTHVYNSLVTMEGNFD